MLYVLYKEKSLAIADLATRLCTHRKDVEDAVNVLVGGEDS